MNYNQINISISVVIALIALALGGGYYVSKSIIKQDSNLQQPSSAPLNTPETIKGEKEVSVRTEEVKTELSKQTTKIPETKTDVVTNQLTQPPTQIIEGLTMINIGTSYWQTWDADADNDGIAVPIRYKNNLGEIIAPDLDALREYAKSVYSDIPSALSSPVQISADVKLYTFAPGTEDKGKLVFSKHYAETEIVYTAITPTVRIPKEEITADPSKDYDYGILEVTIYTPEQGSFSAIKKYVKLYEK